MSRAMIVIHGDADRQRASDWCQRAPDGSRVEFKSSKRSIPQNDRMWAMLSDLATQLKWHGVRLSAADWKLIFLNGLKRECRMVPNLDGNGFVDLGRSSSDLSVAEMSDLMELMSAFGVKHGIRFADDVALA